MLPINGTCAVCGVTDICIITGTGGLRKHGFGQVKPPCPGMEVSPVEVLPQSDLPYIRWNLEHENGDRGENHTRPVAAAVALSATSGIPRMSYESTATSTTTAIHPHGYHSLPTAASTGCPGNTTSQPDNGGSLAVGGGSAIVAWWRVGWTLSSCRLLDRRRLSSGCRRGRAGQPLACFNTSSQTSRPNLNALWAGHASLASPQAAWECLRKGGRTEI